VTSRPRVRKWISNVLPNFHNTLHTDLLVYTGHWPLATGLRRADGGERTNTLLLHQSLPSSRLKDVGTLYCAIA
jgi:hypothetical protein